MSDWRDSVPNRIDGRFIKIFRSHFEAGVSHRAAPTTEGFSQPGIRMKKEIGEILGIGGSMEDMAKLLKEVNSEVQESKKILQNLANEVRAVSDIVGPVLVNQVKELRSSRMAAVSEINQSLKALQDIRTFFLESDYEKEMTRLKEFVGICQDLRMLKQDGTLDLLCETVIRLALKEESDAKRTGQERTD